MEHSLSLVDHLRRAARSRPQALALIHGNQSLNFAELLTAVETVPSAASSCNGSSLDIAFAAYACSAQRKPLAPLPPGQGTKEIPPTPANTALLISTSGSEGAPRQVVLGMAQLDTAAIAANACLALAEGDLWLNCLPLYHIGGLSILWRCARAGATLLLHEGFTVEKVANDLARYPVTHLSLVPAMLSRLLDGGTAPPPSLKAVLIGGAALSRPLYERATAAGWPLFISYGMSETSAMVAAFRPDEGPWREGLVGRPMPGHDIRIGDDGRIRIRGPQVMTGYLDGSGIDAEAWLTTGDLGEVDTDGRLMVLGRADDMLISGGRNVHPQEVESCLSSCTGVLDVAVTGLPDPVWGDLVIALVVGTADADTLLAHARRTLPSAARPRRIVHLERLPRNAAGKLERAMLRRLAAGVTE